MNKNTILTILTVLFCIVAFISCNNTSRIRIEMPGKIDTVRFIPFGEYTLSGLEKAKLVENYNFENLSGIPTTCCVPLTVNSKKLPMVLLDTGCGTSIFNTDSIDYKDLGNSVTSFNAWGNGVPLKNISIDLLKIGKTTIHVKNLDFEGESFITQNIIGYDILKHFVWYIDNFHKEIYFSRDPSVFSFDNWISIPFYTKNDSHHILIKCFIDGKEFEVLLDTGYYGFLNVVDSTEINPSSHLAQPKDTSRFLVKFAGDISGGFANYGMENKTIKENRTVSSVKIGSLTFDYEIVEHARVGMNVLGWDFFQRFEAVVFDYINKKMYLKTDNKELMNNSASYKSTAYLAYLRQYFNSMGLLFSSNEPPSVISSIDDSLIKKGLALGDSLIAIDGKPVTAEEIKSLIFSKQTTMITVKRKNDVFDFHLTRRNYVNEPDTVFSFGEASPFSLKNYNMFTTVTDSLNRKGRIFKYYNVE